MVLKGCCIQTAIFIRTPLAQRAPVAQVVAELCGVASFVPQFVGHIGLECFRHFVNGSGLVK